MMVFSIFHLYKDTLMTPLYYNSRLVEAHAKSVKDTREHLEKFALDRTSGKLVSIEKSLQTGFHLLFASFTCNKCVVYFYKRSYITSTVNPAAYKLTEYNQLIDQLLKPRRSCRMLRKLYIPLANHCQYSRKK